MSDSEMLLNCYTDLQRAAVGYYQVPDGEAAKRFLSHARKIITGLEGRVPRVYADEAKRLDLLVNEVTKTESAGHIAEKLLTLGILLKPSHLVPTPCLPRGWVSPPCRQAG